MGWFLLSLPILALVVLLVLVTLGKSKAIHEAVAKSELMWRNKAESIIDAAPDGFVQIDGTGKVIRWNRAAERMFGWTAADIVGRNVLTIIPPEWRQRHTAGLARLTATGEGKILGKTLELTGLTRGGQTIPVELSIFRYIGNGTTFCAFIRDVSARKLIEAEKDKLQRALESVNQQLALALGTKIKDGR